MDEECTGIGAGGGQVGRALAVDGQGVLFVVLGGVDGGPRGTVDHDVGLYGADRLGDRCRVSDVQVGPGEGGEILAPGPQEVGQVAAEHSGCAGD